MSNWDDYKPEVSAEATGKRRCVVIDVEETESKTSHLPMFVITVTPNGSKAKVKNYIVKNEHFNRNMTGFFDSFGIERGNFNTLEWINAVGAGEFDTDENGYLKVKWFISPKQAEKLPPWDGPMPERQTVTEIGNDFAELPDDDGTLPF
jgi:hypothetical protein